MRLHVFGLLCLFAVAAAQPRTWGWGGCNSAAKPREVRRLKVEPLTATSVQISWKEPSGFACIAGYSYAVLEKNKPAPRSSGSKTQKYTIDVTGLTTGATYTVSVTAVAENGQNGPTKSLDFVMTGPKCKENTKPGAVIDPSVNSVSASILEAFWSAPASGGCATSYGVQAFEAKSNKRVLFASTSTYNIQARGLTANTIYNFQITPENRAGKGPTTTVSGITAPCDLGTVPDLVEGLTATAGSPGEILLKWSGPANGGCVGKYLVNAVGTPQSTTITPTSPAAGASTSFGGQQNTRYTFEVTPLSLTGAKGKTARVSATTSIGGFVPSTSTEKASVGFRG